MSEKMEAFLRAIELLKGAGVDARLSELWRGSERLFCIVLFNVEELEEIFNSEVKNEY